ncbi:hypothetical protein M688_12205 [Neisseria gonorrhoeae SK22871]|nr:hypothetical protein M688_12205 [Neisseria gonorrhoeae SK22871]
MPSEHAAYADLTASSAKRLPCAKAILFSSAVRTGAAVGNIFFDGFADGGHFEDGAQYGFATFNAVDAASDSACGIAGAAVLGIVEDEDFEGIWVHGRIPLK